MPTHHDSPTRSSSKSMAWPISLVICVVVVIVALVLYQCSKIVEKAVDITGDTVSTVLSWPEKVASATGQLLQAKTSISGTSVSLSLEEIAELALIKRKILVYTKQSNTKWGSTAIRIIKGEFELKAGYDLHKVKITFSEPDKTVTISLPKPEILSLTTIDQDTYHLDGGTIKWEPSTKENDQGNKENRNEADIEAMQLGLGKEVEDRMRERVRDLFSPFTEPDKIVFIESASSVPQPKM